MSNGLYPWYRGPVIAIGSFLGFILKVLLALLVCGLAVALFVGLMILGIGFVGLIPAAVLYVCWNWVLAGYLAMQTVPFVVFWAGCTALAFIVRLATNGISSTVKIAGRNYDGDDIRELFAKVSRTGRYSSRW